jgi:peroxiredoxin
MAHRLEVGDEAPNFDLSSTEGALLMLCDEVPRNMVALYFFADLESERTRSDLAALGNVRDSLAAKRVNILGVSPAKMPGLEDLQSELGLSFPLLRDDRDFSSSYGVEKGEEDAAAEPALVLVSRTQSVLWIANPVQSVESALVDLTKAADTGSPTSNYPKKVINRIVDRWVN